jgi:hypothetical protein
MFKAHSHATPKKDDLDGERYLDVLNWVMRMVSLLQAELNIPERSLTWSRAH